jgi:hypothetical protein
VNNCTGYGGGCLLSSASCCYGLSCKLLGAGLSACQ